MGALGRRLAGAGNRALRGLAARLAAPLALALLLAGCATGSPYSPRPAFSIDQDIEELHQEFAAATSIKEYYDSGPETVEQRNRFIAGRLTLYDLEYVRFLSRFRLTRAASSTALDAVAIGISSATTLFGGERTKELLGAVSTALSGTRSAYEKNFYDDQTASALVTQMNAERKTMLLPILQGSKASIADYPMTQAIVDLNAYQFAGTISGALAGVQRDAAAKDADATEMIDRFRAVAFAPDDSTGRIRRWIFPGLESTDSAGVARDSSGNPIAADPQRVAALRAELEKLGLGGIPIATFLASGDLADVRARAIADLQIP